MKFFEMLLSFSSILTKIRVKSDGHCGYKFPWSMFSEVLS